MPKAMNSSFNKTGFKLPEMLMRDEEGIMESHCTTENTPRETFRSNTDL